MKNCLILGFGRSGTSLMGGILHQAGYYMGDNLYPPRNSNPMGFFECADINNINEDILMEYDFYKKQIGIDRFSKKKYSPLFLDKGQRWLTYISHNMDIASNKDEIKRRILNLTSKEPFAFKDPRFNHTFKIWNKYVKPETKYICIFREPENTINSVIKECNEVDYLSDFYIDWEIAEIIWINSYVNLLKNYLLEKERFIFIHYAQLLDGSILQKLSDFLNADLKPDFVSKELNRSNSRIIAGSKSRLVYNKLCRLSGYLK